MVKTPLYPEYGTVKQVLKILDGVNVNDFKNMWNSIWGLRGTPQNTVNWKDPDFWIKDRLEGKDKELALKIWIESNKTINPRYIRGTQFFMNAYNLIQEKNTIFVLTNDGKEFISKTENDFISLIDKKEGLVQILMQLSYLEKEKVKRSDLLNDWKNYLINNSNIKKDSVVKDTLRRRIVNLIGRDYIKKEGNLYSMTNKGENYLTKVIKNSLSIKENNESKLVKLKDQLIKEQRKELKSFLSKTHPYQFEHIVKHLLDEMGYEEVEVTSPTNDKGVDVTGISQNGITTVKEVIQVKRNNKSNITRTVLDKLRGSLHRFDAFQGTIITLSDFAKGAKESAFEKGAAPITLINGEKLIDLLIEHKIGINPKTVEYYTVDENYFNDEIEENIE
ncbi:restriction endonuclease [uncultured Polaribacter sp.]|uniref:restriction endonuclease n=1 Tax=uncultured Polaribacter sp. TaxID=174711 RepID=UPI002602E6D4|nr:restriction endonuclease [uncultured Polaribacter sp.]